MYMIEITEKYFFVQKIWQRTSSKTNIENIFDYVYKKYIYINLLKG